MTELLNAAIADALIVLLEDGARGRFEWENAARNLRAAATPSPEAGVNDLVRAALNVALYHAVTPIAGDIKDGTASEGDELRGAYAVLRELNGGEDEVWAIRAGLAPSNGVDRTPTDESVAAREPSGDTSDGAPALGNTGSAERRVEAPNAATSDHDASPDPAVYPKEWPLPKPPIRTPVRHHVRHEWFFTRMPNGDVMVSAGDGIQMLSIAPNEWESVVREMAEAFQNDTVSTPAPESTPDFPPMEVFTQYQRDRAKQLREEKGLCGVLFHDEHGDGQMCIRNAPCSVHDAAEQPQRTGPGVGSTSVVDVGATPSDCVFCRDVLPEGKASRFKELSPHVVAFQPLNPVREGHTLIVPRRHVTDALEDPDLTALVMREAAAYAKLWRPCNIITSVGIAATQSVFHLHVHIVPRRPNDGLKLPWSTDSATVDTPENRYADRFDIGGLGSQE